MSTAIPVTRPPLLVRRRNVSLAALGLLLVLTYLGGVVTGRSLDRSTPAQPPARPPCPYG